MTDSFQDVIPWQTALLNLAVQTLARLQVKREDNRSGLVRNLALNSLLPEEAAALRRVLGMRRKLAADDQTISIRDYGTGGKDATNGTTERSVSSLYRSSAIPHWWGMLLFRSVRLLRPRTVLELGTNLGVSAAYLQSALDLNNDGFLTTIEGDATLAGLAREAVRRACVGKPEMLVGTFGDVMPGILPKLGRVDLAFVDGHHEYEPTLQYFEMINRHLSPAGAVIFDDIYFWSRPVRRAWKEIVKKCKGGAALDLAKLGILFPNELPPNKELL